MQDIKNKVEAVLFTTGKFLTIEEISELTGISQLDLIKESIENLINDYNNKETSLEIIQQGNQYKLNLKKDYMNLTTKLFSSTELEKPVQETLALIAYKQPVLQSIIIKMRGNTA
ncbi:MAG: SMC-Scp complex subunit ScpB, partial [Nanoarchaeota archaeon]